MPSCCFHIGETREKLSFHSRKTQYDLYVPRLELLQDKVCFEPRQAERR